MKIESIVVLGTTWVLGMGTAWSAMGKAVIKGTAPDSKISGTVLLEDTKEGLKVSAEIAGAPAGDHGFHIHEFGDCGDLGKNAGSHYNPSNTPHGHVMKDGLMKAHAGDMGNLTIKADGTGKLDAVIPGVTLADGKFSVGGRAVVFHEKADDFGQPVGNAGGRIGCGPILLMGK